MTAQTRPIRMLIIDDDAMSRELLALLLEREGYLVSAAETGEVALAMLAQSSEQTEIVLSDVQLPGISGFRLATELRRACGTASLLVAMSGSEPSDEAISLFDGFLMKPFRMQEVTSALAAWNPRQSSPAICASSLEAASRNGKSGHTQVHLPDSANIAKAANCALPVLNETVYQRLCGAMSAQQLQEMYLMCLHDARNRIANMRELAAAHDTANFAREAHAIKGSCGMLGATELHGLAAELETGSPGIAGADEVNSLDELFAACDRLERMLGSRV
jgi:DNA-binding response OmpR family regulator